MRDKFKLRHLDILIEEDPEKRDTSILMKEILGYKQSFFSKTKWFLKNFVKIKEITNEIVSIKYEDIELDKEHHIKYPAAIDHISYLQMVNLQSLTNSPNDFTMSEHMARVIAIATYSENKFSKYEPESESFIRYKNYILESKMFSMIGLYTFIMNGLEKVGKSWDEKFLSVEVIDEDLEAHGGEQLQQFNIINTIKTICSDFNCDESEAWHKSYYMVMSNSYSKAYANYIQKQIQITKEAQIRSKQIN